MPHLENGPPLPLFLTTGMLARGWVCKNKWTLFMASRNQMFSHFIIFIPWISCFERNYS
jgi:hypothetical protein